MTKLSDALRMAKARDEIFHATPTSVWREYSANGYGWIEAMNEELSYAETLKCK